VSDRAYLPALRFPALTRFFDPVVCLAMPERRFKGALVEQAAPRPGQRVLDIGCGTGTLALMAKEDQPEAEVVGLDADPKILERARAKAEGAGLEIRFDEALSTELPYRDRSFDLVLSTLFFHHLSSADKRRTAVQIARVLRPGGELHVADWGRQRDPLMRAAIMSVRLFDGFEQTADNVAGALPEIFGEAGFDAPTETNRFRTVFGSLSLYRARRPARDGRRTR
jgi:SAM-dependent methyltransferase